MVAKKNKSKEIQKRGKRSRTTQKSAAPVRSSQPAPELLPASNSSPKNSTPVFPIVGVGASAGGLDAFTQLLRNLPATTGMAFVLVQHLDPDHESALAQILGRATSMPVLEVTNGMRIAANHIYIIPPNTDMAIAQRVLKLHRRQAVRAPHHSIDFFFQSLAQDQHERAIGVILSGTASDGTLGLEAIKAESGIVFAQDESARYDSMPRSAIAAGCVDFVLPPEGIAQELARIASHPYVAGQPRAPARKVPPEREDVGQKGFKKILLLLHDHSGVDFSLYKLNTIHRRIARRMLLNKIDKLGGYAAFLSNNPIELEALYSDMLISVTSFFRNPGAFEILQAKVFRKLNLQPRDKPIRGWISGCSTGQEAYSIAMSFVEFSERAGHTRKLQLFATDVNETVLNKGRAGIYAKGLVQDIAPERLRRFFVEEDGDYRVARFFREMVIFARHNLMSDPPFSQMDLVSCRNLLIYLEPDLQRKVLPMIHYALKPGGFLILGESESLGPMTELFEAVDKRYKIFSKKPGHVARLQLVPHHLVERKAIPFSRSTAIDLRYGPQKGPEAFPSHLDAQREADRVTLNRFAPASVLIDAQLQVLQFRGETGLFLKAHSNTVTDVLKMAHEGLMIPLRAAIEKAHESNKAVRREGVRVVKSGRKRKVNFEVVPLTHLRQQCCLIFFEEANKSGQTRKDAGRPGRLQAKQADGYGIDSRVAELELELAEHLDYTQSLQEQHEAANEELQASNEEVISANEELQSINEELETSKEELESSNEELTTINDEMLNRNAELSRVNADLNNLQASIKVAILLLTRTLTIRRFTPEAGKLFNLLAGDVGRPLSNVRHNLDPNDLEQVLREVIDTFSPRELEVRDKEGRWYSLRIRPYLTLDDKIDGVVVVLVDIDAIKRNEQEIKAARDYAETILRTTRYPLVVLAPDLRVEKANRAFYQTFKVSPGETEGKLIYEAGNGQWNIRKLREGLQEILPRNSFFDDFEVTHDFEHIGRRTMLLNARQMYSDENDGPKRILLAIEDITDNTPAEKERKQLLAREHGAREEAEAANRGQG